MMKLVSLNVGAPRIVETPRGGILTSIFKEPVEGRRAAAPHNIEGDKQADLTVHGGPYKAVYGYSWDHYRYWRNELNDADLGAGAFGENLTVEGLSEEDLHVGDLVEIGTARLRVTQPRMPCYKLALRFDRADMVKRFWKSRMSGFYFSIETPGELGAGDELRVVEVHPLSVSIADVVRMYQGESKDKDLYRRIVASPLRGSWRQGIQERWTEGEEKITSLDNRPSP